MMMRTTINLPDGAYEVARSIPVAKDVSLGDAVAELVRKALRPESRIPGWFIRKRAAGFRTCPTTQAGLVRISSNPAFTSNAVTPGEALALLDRVTRPPGYDFWPDYLSLPAAPRQARDEFLLALAAGHRGVLATLDQAAALLAKGDPEAVEIVFAP